MSEMPIPIKKAMRDAFLQEVLKGLDAGENIVFLSADFGAPVLDQIRERHPTRFINVGIAEQNLVNLATGYGLEGFTVYAYAIAPFITMRCYEQIRLNLAILSQLRPMNVNLVGVGAGFSYDVSGPTHHCLEDLSIMRTLPNLEVISPSDWITASHLFRYSMDNMGPKYLRFDAKPHPQIHSHITVANWRDGFIELQSGHDIALVATGIMTHKAQAVAAKLEAQGHSVGVVDLIKVKGFDSASLSQVLKNYKKVLSLEEGFIGKGGVDAAVSNLLQQSRIHAEFRAVGINDHYSFEIGSRDYLHQKNSLDVDSIVKAAV